MYSGPNRSPLLPPDFDNGDSQNNNPDNIPNENSPEEQQKPNPDQQQPNSPNEQQNSN